MKLIFSCAAVLWLVISATSGGAAVVVTAGELAVNTAGLTVIPAPSAVDPLNGKVAVQIDSRTNHGGGAIDFPTFTDGSDAVAYPGQLPQDYPGVNTHCVEMFWDVRAGTEPVNLSEVRVYCANSGNDCRVVPNVDVSYTTVAPPTAAGPWTSLITYARPNVAPANFDYGMQNTTNGIGAIRIQDNSAAKMASLVTGLRVDFYASGFANDFRNPQNINPAPEAVTTPFIAEIDAFFTTAAGVTDWQLYQD